MTQILCEYSQKAEIHGLILKGLGTGLSHKGCWGRETSDFSMSSFYSPECPFYFKKAKLSRWLLLLQDVPRFCSALWFTGGKVFEVLVILFVYLGGVFLCDRLRESVSSFVFLNFILYLHHRLLDRSEAQFALGTYTSK